MSPRNQCASCGVLMPALEGAGRPRQHCDNDRCTYIFNSGANRLTCQRCRAPIPDEREAQRQAICMRCVEDLCDLLGIVIAARPTRRSSGTGPGG